MAIPPEPNLVLGPTTTATVFLSQPNADFALTTSGARYFWFAYPPSELPDRIIFREVRVRGRLRMSFAEMMLRFVSKDSGYQWHGFSHGAEINEVLHDIIPSDLASVLGFTATPLDSDPQGMIHEAWLEITYQPFDFAPVEDPPPPLSPIDGFPDGAVGTRFALRKTGGVSVANASYAGSAGLYLAEAISWDHDRQSLWVVAGYLVDPFSSGGGSVGWHAIFMTLEKHEPENGPYERRQELSSFEERAWKASLGHLTSYRVLHYRPKGTRGYQCGGMTQIGGGQYVLIEQNFADGKSRHDPGFDDDGHWSPTLSVLDAAGKPTGRIVPNDVDTGYYGESDCTSNGSVLLVWGHRPMRGNADFDDWDSFCTAVDLDTGREVAKWKKHGFAGGIAYVGGGKALILHGGNSTFDYAYFIMLVDALTGEEYARVPLDPSDDGSSFAYRRHSPDNPQAGGVLAVRDRHGGADYSVSFYEVTFDKPALRQATRDDWLGGDADRPQEMPNHPTSTQQSIRQFGPPNTYV